MNGSEGIQKKVDLVTFDKHYISQLMHQYNSKNSSLAIAKYLKKKEPHSGGSC